MEERAQKASPSRQRQTILQLPKEASHIVFIYYVNGSHGHTAMVPAAKDETRAYCDRNERLKVESIMGRNASRANDHKMASKITGMKPKSPSRKPVADRKDPPSRRNATVRLVEEKARPQASQFTERATGKTVHFKTSTNGRPSTNQPNPDVKQSKSKTSNKPSQKQQRTRNTLIHDKIQTATQYHTRQKAKKKTTDQANLLSSHCAEGDSKRCRARSYDRKRPRASKSARVEEVRSQERSLKRRPQHLLPSPVNHEKEAGMVCRETERLPPARHAKEQYVSTPVTLEAEQQRISRLIA